MRIWVKRQRPAVGTTARGPRQARNAVSFFFRLPASLSSRLAAPPSPRSLPNQGKAVCYEEKILARPFFFLFARRLLLGRPISRDHGKRQKKNERLDRGSRCAVGSARSPKSSRVACSKDKPQKCSRADHVPFSPFASPCLPIHDSDSLLDRLCFSYPKPPEKKNEKPPPARARSARLNTSCRHSTSSTRSAKTSARPTSPSSVASSSALSSRPITPSTPLRARNSKSCSGRGRRAATTEASCSESRMNRGKGRGFRGA